MTQAKLYDEKIRTATSKCVDDLCEKFHGDDLKQEKAIRYFHVFMYYSMLSSVTDDCNLSPEREKVITLSSTEFGEKMLRSINHAYHSTVGLYSKTCLLYTSPSPRDS